MLFLGQADELPTILAVLLLVILGLAAGIAKCWSVSRRPAANAKCVMALAVFLIGCLVPVLTQTLSLIVPIPFLSLITFTSFGIILASAVLAVVGLREYSRRAGTYAQGKTQAICALALSALVACLPLAFLAQLRWDILPTSGPPAGARVLLFEDLNFKFFAPGGNWIEVGTNDLTLNGTVAFRFSRSEMYFVVVAQKTGDKYYSADQLAEVAMKDLSNSVDEIRLVYRGPVQIDRLEGLRLDNEAKRSGESLYFEHRLFAINGWAYQLITWGSKSLEANIAEQAETLARRFELLDYYRPLQLDTNLTRLLSL